MEILRNRLNELISMGFKKECISSRAKINIKTLYNFLNGANVSAVVEQALEHAVISIKEDVNNI